MAEWNLDQLYEKSKDLHAGEVILDVRSPEEFAESRIKGAINIPHDEVGDKSEELRQYKKIFIHCGMGGRAQKAYQTLLAMGHDNVVCIADAGIEIWKDKGYPTES